MGELNLNQCMCITFQIAAVLWWFYFSKIAELLDTVSGPIFLNSACTSIGNNLFNKIIYLLLVMQICVRQFSDSSQKKQISNTIANCFIAILVIPLSQIMTSSCIEKNKRSINIKEELTSVP